MLKAMRKHAKGFYFLFGLVIFTFIFWGVGRVDNEGERQFVIELGEDKVTLTDYWRRYDSVADVYREVYKEKVDEAMLAELKDRILETMTSEVVLHRAALDAGLAVSDKELEAAITSDEAFQSGGAFSSQIYERTLQLNRLTPTLYESMKRRELLVEKMKLLVESSVSLSPAETKALSGDPKLAGTLRETLLEAKRREALQSYVNGILPRFDLKVSRNLIS